MHFSVRSLFMTHFSMPPPIDTEPGILQRDLRASAKLCKRGIFQDDDCISAGETREMWVSARNDSVATFDNRQDSMF